MKTIIAILACAIATNIAFASDEMEFNSAGDFVAPSVSTPANLPGKITGQIYYDLTDGAFRGVNKYGTIDTLSAPGNPVSSDNPNERIERLLMSTICTGALPNQDCAITSQSGGVASVHWNSTGNYTINFISGKYSASPTCVAVSLGTTNTFCAGGGSGPTTAVIDCRRTSTEASMNTGLSVICMGPR